MTKRLSLDIDTLFFFIAFLYNQIRRINTYFFIAIMLGIMRSRQFST